MSQSKRCDLNFAGIGRLAKATGAHTQAEYQRRVAILRELYENGGEVGWTALEAIRDARFTVTEVCAGYRAKRLDRLWDDLVLSQLVAAAVEAWLPASAKAMGTRQRYTGSWRSLQRSLVIGPTFTLHELEAVDWRALQETWPGGRHNWKHLRGFLSRFLTVAVGVEHRFRRALLAKIPRPGKIPGRVPDLTPAKFWEIVQAMPPHVCGAPVVIVVTGMRVGEFIATQETDLRPLTKGVRIPGTKTEESEAVQPVDPQFWAWVEHAIPCPVGQWRLRELWRQACARVGVEGVTLHDLRHCHGQWLVNAGRPEESVQRSLRHTTAESTRLYVTQKGRQENASTLGRILAEAHDSSTAGKRRRKGKRA